MGAFSWGFAWEVFKWLTTCAVMAAPFIHEARNSREIKGGKQASFAGEWVKPRRPGATDRPLIERTANLLSDLEEHVLPVIHGKALLTVVTVSCLREAELVARIAAKERALVECGLLIEPAGVSYYLENLLLLPFSPARQKSADELGLIAMRQAYAARDLWEAIQKLRRAIGPVD